MSAAAVFFRGMKRWAVLLALLLAACDSKVELISNITQTQANDVIAALAQRGISADKIPGKEGMVSLQVPQATVARAIEIMNAEGLPRAPYASLGDVFKKDGLISSPTEERARMLFALSQELSRTISKIDGVIFAQVHVVLPDRGGFGQSGNPSSAAVFIKYEDTASVDQFIPQIRRLVSNSIPGLTYDKVSVELVPSSSPTGLSPTPTAELESVWSVQVAGDSVSLLRAILGGLTGLLLVACAGIAFLLLKSRRTGESGA